MNIEFGNASSEISSPHYLLQSSQFGASAALSLCFCTRKLWCERKIPPPPLALSYFLILCYLFLHNGLKCFLWMTVLNASAISQDVSPILFRSLSIIVQFISSEKYSFRNNWNLLCVLLLMYSRVEQGPLIRYGQITFPISFHEIQRREQT